jgi:hypothetical protein
MTFGTVPVPEGIDSHGAAKDRPINDFPNDTPRVWLLNAYDV